MNTKRKYLLLITEDYGPPERERTCSEMILVIVIDIIEKEVKTMPFLKYCGRFDRIKQKGSLCTKRCPKRAWFSSPSAPLSDKEYCKKTVPASMTVEAALIVPAYLFFLAMLLLTFDMLRLQNNMLEALHQTGSEMSVYAYYFRYALPDVLESAGAETSDSNSTSDTDKEKKEVLSSILRRGGSILMSETYVRNNVKELLGEDYLNNSCLRGGASSVSYLRSEIMEGGDIIDLVADYRVKPFIEVPGFDGFSMQNRYYGHAFVGYSVSSGSSSSSKDEETMVYITPTGTVYHLSEECTHLKLSIHTIDASDLASARNADGARYYPCETCNPSKSGTLLITTEGNRYHSSTSCPALKRTIYTVTLSSVQDSMPACSKCGG